VLTVPFLKNLREAFPAAHIDIMLDPPSGQAIEGCPYADRIIFFDTGKTDASATRSSRGGISAWFRSWKLVRKKRYDAAFVLGRSLLSALLVRAARVPRRIGFQSAGRGLLLTDVVPGGQDRHEVENILDCLRVLNVPVRTRTLELWPGAAQKKKVSDLLQEPGWKASDLKIIVHPVSDHPAKQWPLERFAAVMSVLKRRYNARFIYAGAAGDAPLYAKIEKQGPFGGLDLCGKTSIRESISLYRSADLFFGVDSDAMHLATAAGIPVVALFGPTDERKWGPWGEKQVVVAKRPACAPCRRDVCRDDKCMKQISVDDALDAVDAKIRQIYPKVLHD
jgi:ADP-heptose:LPS heptosyltransferase